MTRLKASLKASEVFELARIYSGLASQALGREVQILGIKAPRRSRWWPHFQRLRFILKEYKGIWDEREVFLTAQFKSSRPTRLPIPYPNMLYGYSAWRRFEWYRNRRRRTVDHPKAFARPEAVNDRAVVAAFRQSAEHYKTYRKMGWKTRDLYTQFRDLFADFFIATDPTVQVALAGGRHPYDAEIVAARKELKRRPTLRRLLEKMWGKHVETP